MTKFKLTCQYVISIMSFGILLFIGLTLLFVYLFKRWYKQRVSVSSLESFEQTATRDKIDFMEFLGNNIREFITNTENYTNPSFPNNRTVHDNNTNYAKKRVNIHSGNHSNISHPNHMNINNTNNNNNIQYNIRENIDTFGTINKQYDLTLPIQLEELSIKTTNIVIGKYKLTDPETINYVTSSIKKVLSYLSSTKSIDSILMEYDPIYSNDLLLEACRDLFECPLLDPMKKILVGQFIANKTGDQNEIDLVYNYIIRIALDPDTDRVIRMNAADILNLSNNSRYIRHATRALDLLRREDDALPIPAQETIMRRQPMFTHIRPMTADNERQDLIIIPPLIGQEDRDINGVLWTQLTDRLERPRQQIKIERNIYQDGQNVHNTEINESVLSAAKELVNEYKVTSQKSFDKSLISGLPLVQKDKIESALHRIYTDSSTFKYGTNLYSIFQSLLLFIDTHTNKDELNSRLIQELMEMSTLCATGHLSRLMNVLQGFDVKPELKIKMDLTEEIYAKISHVLQKKIMADSESDILLGIIGNSKANSNEKNIMNRFISKELSLLIPEFIKEYKDIEDTDKIKNHVLKAATRYTKSGNFRIVGDDLSSIDYQ